MHRQCRKPLYACLVRRGMVFVCAVLMLLTRPMPLSAAEPMAGGQVVRVLLSQFGQSGTLRVGIYGSYLMDEQLAFQRGTWLNVFTRDGVLWLSYEGMSYRAGRRVVLARYPDEGDENGLRLDNSLNLFHGDLVLSAEGTAIRAVLHIPIEEYLLGVVPYEMNNDFPLEALKAQAVAARTYAAGNRDANAAYDVSDTTGDQVYRGYDPAYLNARKAVMETARVYVFAGDRFAQCYYTASNGGQTESAYNAWGRERIPYLPVHDDPYDMENPGSEVRSATIDKQVRDGIVANQSFTDALKTRLVPHLESMNLNPALDAFRIDTVIGCQAHTARHPGDSRLMTRVQLTLMISAQRGANPDNDQEVSIEAATPAPGAVNETTRQKWEALRALTSPVKVDLDYFDLVEPQLSLSINRNANELVTVRETDTAFVLEARRYGHGVGLSQRGAEWMAKTYGWTYEQILRFYYPGTALRTLEEKTVETREPFSARFLSTPGPVPTATPRPTLMPRTQTPAPGQWVVAVHGVSRNSTLNLRDQPNLNGKVLVQLFYGQELLVLERLAEGWLRVRTDTLEGYVMEQFVQQLSPP